MRLAIPILLLFACVAQAAPIGSQLPDTNPATLAAADMTLPEDGHAWIVTCFTSGEGLPDQQRWLDWFSTDPQLVRLKQQTHFNHYTPKSTMWSKYWNVKIGSVPSVMVQRPLPSGGYRLVARFQAPSVYFRDSHTLAAAISGCIRAETNNVGGLIFNRSRPWCPDCRPRPEPQPQPAPVVDVNVGPFAKPLLPDIGPPEEDEDEEEEDELPPVQPAMERDETQFMLILALIAIPVGLIVIAGGLAIGWQLYKPKHRFYKHR